jgi:pimeloyl-ACP methyl ester carboxylesterase
VACRRPRLALLAAAAAACALPGAADAELRFAPCPASEADGFDCATLTVPLARDGRLPGTVDLRVARERGGPAGRKLLLALTGGPGQPGVAFGPSWRFVFDGVHDRYRLVVLDPRGTGRSGLLRCPELQRQSLTDVTVRAPGTVEACAARLGPARDSYATTETVGDIEAFRAALGAETVAVAGVSYALRYARAHPDRVERLILDSVVPQENVGLDLPATWPAIRRLLVDLCGTRRCRDITRDPVADLAAVVGSLGRRPLVATLYDARGRPRRAVLRDPAALYDLLLLSAIDRGVRSDLPAVLAAAAGGDAAPLLRTAERLRHQRVPARTVDWAVHAAALCADHPPAASVGLLPGELVAPFTPSMAAQNGAHDTCRRWPTPAIALPPEPGPLPDVPALFLAGQYDVLTPRSGALREARRSPRGQVVTVPGVGHSTLTGANDCARAAVRRFVRDRPAGGPCRRARREPPDLRPAFPQRLRDVDRVPGVPGRPGLALAVFLKTYEDAVVGDHGDGAFSGNAGGLRGGSMTTGRVVRLRRLVYVPGVAVTGTIDFVGGAMRARVRVRGRGLDARFGIVGERVEGVVDGRPFAGRVRV